MVLPWRLNLLVLLFALYDEITVQYLDKDTSANCILKVITEAGGEVLLKPRYIENVEELLLLGCTGKSFLFAYSNSTSRVWDPGQQWCVNSYLFNELSVVYNYIAFTGPLIIGEEYSPILDEYFDVKYDILVADFEHIPVWEHNFSNVLDDILVKYEALEVNMVVDKLDKVELTVMFSHFCYVRSTVVKNIARGEKGQLTVTPQDSVGTKRKPTFSYRGAISPTVMSTEIQFGLISWKTISDVKLTSRLQDGTNLIEEGHGEENGDEPFEFKRDDEQLIVGVDRVEMTRKKSRFRHSHVTDSSIFVELSSQIVVNNMSFPLLSRKSMYPRLWNTPGELLLVARSCCITELVGLFYNRITNFQLASFGYHNNWTMLNIPASHIEQIQCVIVAGFVHLLQNMKASLAISKATSGSTSEQIKYLSSGGGFTYEHSRTWLGTSNFVETFGDIVIAVSYVDCSTALLQAPSVNVATTIQLSSNLEDKVLFEGGSIVMNQSKPTKSTNKYVTLIDLGLRRSDWAMPSQRLIWDSG